MKLFKNKKGQLFGIAGLTVGIVIALLVFIPVFIGGMGIAAKVWKLLFFTPVGNFPMWAIFFILILGYIVIKKSRKKGYGHYIP